MEKEGGQVLMPVEAEAYVESLEYFDLKDIGSSRYFFKYFSVLLSPNSIEILYFFNAIINVSSFLRLKSEEDKNHS